MNELKEIKKKLKILIKDIDKMLAKECSTPYIELFLKEYFFWCGRKYGKPNVKEKTLMKKLVKEYGGETIEKVIPLYIRQPGKYYHSISDLYYKRRELFPKLLEKDYSEDDPFK